MILSQKRRTTTVMGTPSPSLTTMPIFGPRKITSKPPRKFRTFARGLEVFRSPCVLVRHSIGQYATVLKYYLEGGAGYKLSHQFESSSQVARCAVQPGNVEDLSVLDFFQFLSGLLSKIGRASC